MARRGGGASSVVPIRPAATVLLLRDGTQGLEVLLLRRTTDAVFSPGAHVFPGGAVDDADGAPAVAKWCGGFSDVAASAALGVEHGGLAYYVAAIRECFEEAGVLLARHAADGTPVRLHDEAIASRFREHRRGVHGGTLAMADLCAAEALALSVDALLPFGHWITPPGGPRRYDTRFFITTAPGDQEPAHDEQETTAHGWHRPIDILAAHRRGEVDLILPTQRTLELIADGRDVDGVLGEVVV
jgi:8-oxo-dGTP pyrophosphatase MutT (NUDIX family)